MLTIKNDLSDNILSICIYAYICKNKQYISLSSTTCKTALYVFGHRQVEKRMKKQYSIIR